MTDPLGRIEHDRKIGDEPFRAGDQPLGYDLLSFWQWVTSDLVSNATRGRVAEYIVARALGLATGGLREEWAAFDLRSPTGVTVEVKSAAYLQTWHQKKRSAITFRVRKTRAWDATTNVQDKVAKRQAQVYVFTLLAHENKASVNPLNVSQWVFYVLPTRELDARTRSQHSITLTSLKKLCQSIRYEELAQAVEVAGQPQPAPGAGESSGQVSSTSIAPRELGPTYEA